MCTLCTYAPTWASSACGPAQGGLRAPALQGCYQTVQVVGPLQRWAKQHRGLQGQRVWLGRSRLCGGSGGESGASGRLHAGGDVVDGRAAGISRTVSETASVAGVRRGPSQRPLAASFLVGRDELWPLARADCISRRQPPE